MPLPPKAGNYNSLAAVAGKVLYRRVPRTGSGEEKASIVYYDLEEREEKTVLEDAEAFVPTADGKKLFVLAEKKFGFIEVKESRRSRSRCAPASSRPPSIRRPSGARCSPTRSASSATSSTTRACTASTGRRCATRYQALIDAAVTRWDVNFVLGEFIGELNASHTYRGGGDVEKAAERGVGVLGVDWALENGAYRIKHIAGGATWDADARSPLARSRRQRQGRRLRAGRQRRPARTDQDPLAAFQGLADKTVMLTVNATPSTTGARQVTVRCLGDDTQMRFREWIEAQPRPRRQGHQRPRRLHLRPEHRASTRRTS